MQGEQNMINKAYIKITNKNNRNLLKQILTDNFKDFEMDWDNDIATLIVMDCESFQWQLKKLLSMSFQDFNVQASILIVPFFDYLFLKYLDKLNNKVCTAFEVFIRNIHEDFVQTDAKEIIFKLGQKNMDTLKAFLNCNGNSCETANELFIHRNTFNYRINQLVQLNNIDIRDLNTLMFFNLIINICA